MTTTNGLGYFGNHTTHETGMICNVSFRKFLLVSLLAGLAILLRVKEVNGFVTSVGRNGRYLQQQRTAQVRLFVTGSSYPMKHKKAIGNISDGKEECTVVHNNRNTIVSDSTWTRRAALGRSISTSTLVLLGSFMTPVVSFAAATTTTIERQSLAELLYRIVRVREATQQETRLITTGKFKDSQRANIKLAIKFMIENYRLNDAFVSAATYIDGPSTTRLEAGQVGQRAVQNLYTILEYFDSSDVQNLKVGQSLTTSGRESLVLKGLDSTRQAIDDYLSYFPKSVIDSVIAQVEMENELNVKEFDPALGVLINMPVTNYQ